MVSSSRALKTFPGSWTKNDDGGRVVTRPTATDDAGNHEPAQGGALPRTIDHDGIGKPLVAQSCAVVGETPTGRPRRQQQHGAHQNVISAVGHGLDPRVRPRETQEIPVCITMIAASASAKPTHECDRMRPTDSQSAPPPEDGDQSSNAREQCDGGHGTGPFAGSKPAHVADQSDMSDRQQQHGTSQSRQETVAS